MSLSAHTTTAPENQKSNPSLVQLCRDIVVTNLERYPPHAFSVLDEFEWETIIQLKHEKTRPKTGFRVAPAVTDKFLSHVEAFCPRLGESDVVDVMVWKDCVEHKFKEGGLSRPRGLLYPWPVLVAMLRKSGEVLLELVRKTGPCAADDRKKAIEAINTLAESPMNVRLILATGVGKSVKSFLKALDNREEGFLGLNQRSPGGGGKSPSSQSHKDRLSAALQSWLAMAASAGVKMKPGEKKAAGPILDNDKKRDHESLKIAEECQSWRQLFCTLKEQDEKFRQDQGVRMRERRQKLDKARPKIVKVIPNARRHDAILSRASYRLGGGGGGSSSAASSQSSPSKNKIQQLRMEASVQSARRMAAAPSKLKMSSGVSGGGRSSGESGFGVAVATESGFGAAVAFAALQGASKKRKSTTTVTLGQGKRMAVPDAKRAGQNLKKRLGLVNNRGPPAKPRK
jgi:hypothetical protein